MTRTAGLIGARALEPFGSQIRGADGLGLIAVAAAARGFTQKTRSGESRHEPRNAAQMVVGEQVRARQALGNLYPDLVA